VLIDEVTVKIPGDPFVWRSRNLKLLCDRRFSSQTHHFEPITIIDS